MKQSDLINKITAYLSNGGLFNPELANHIAVRDLLIECREALAQPEQEPVAFLTNKRQRLNIELKPQTFVEVPTVTDWEMPLYMKPTQRTWVGLTDEDIWTVLQFRGYNTDTIEIAKAIEAKLKQKNGYAEEKNT